MGKPTICIGGNKDADQLRGNREADQRLCFRYTDSTLPLLPKSEISSFQPASVFVQLGLCRTCSETTLLVFPRGGSYLNYLVYEFHSVRIPIFIQTCTVYIYTLGRFFNMAEILFWVVTVRSCSCLMSYEA